MKNNKYYYRIAGKLIPYDYVHLLILTTLGFSIFLTSSWISEFVFNTIAEPGIRFVNFQIYDIHVKTFIISIFLTIVGSIIAATSFIALLVTIAEDFSSFLKRNAISVEEAERVETKKLLAVIAEIAEIEEKGQKGKKMIVNE